MDEYIPPHKRVIDASEETSPEGSNYNFVFYDRRNLRGKKKKAIPPIGEAVSVSLSTGAMEEIKDKQKPEGENKNVEKKDEDKKPPEDGGGHINITV